MMDSGNKMGTMPVRKLLITMSLPMIISMLVQAMYNIVDSMFVAKLSEEALTAVSLAYPLQSLMISFAGGTAVGVNALLSRSLGEQNQKYVNDTALNSIFIFLITTIVFMVCGFLFSHLFFQIQTTNQDIIKFGTQYTMIVMGVSFAMFFQFLFERLLQATGRTFLTMITQSVGAIINIILDPILIFGLFGLPMMGVAGAALATVIGQIIACLLAIFFNIRYNHDIQLQWKNFHLDFQIIRQVYSVGIPSIIMQSIGSIMTFGINAILITFSTTATAVFGIYYKLQNFVFMPVFGLNNSMIPILAYNLGAKEKKRMLETIKLSTIYATGMMIIGIIIFECFPEMLLGLFNASYDMLIIGVPALRITSVSFIFAGFTIICNALFQAVGKGTYSLIVSLIRQLVILLPCAYILSLFENITYIWFAFIISEFLSVFISIYFFKKIKRNLLMA